MGSWRDRVVRDPEELKRTDTAFVGGGDEAVMEAVYRTHTYYLNRMNEVGACRDDMLVNPMLLALSVYEIEEVIMALQARGGSDELLRDLRTHIFTVREVAEGRIIAGSGTD